MIYEASGTWVFASYEPMFSIPDPVDQSVNLVWCTLPERTGFSWTSPGTPQLERHPHIHYPNRGNELEVEVLLGTSNQPLEPKS